MTRIAPFSRTRIVVSLLSGGVAIIVTVCGVWSTLPGDDPKILREVSVITDRIAEPELLAAHIAAQRTGFHPRGFDPSLLSPLVTPTEWDNVKAAADRLRYPNCAIARAKVLAVLA